MIRTGDTIVLPQQSTRADGIDPDIAKGDGERAIFCYPGEVEPYAISCAWVAQTDVRLAKAIVVVSSHNGGWVKFRVNDQPIATTLNITGPHQQVTFTENVELRAEVDTLKVQYAIGCFGNAVDMSVFVSFSKVDPL